MEKVQNSILIVDDEATNIAVLARVLGDEYTIYAAKDGASAISMAKKHLPDLILLDVIMPDMDGYAVLSTLKKANETKGIPVVFITGLVSSKDEERALALDAADYISKPFSDVVVKLRVRNQIKIINARRTIERLYDSERQAEERGRLLLDASPVACFLLDKDRRAIDCNQAALYLFVKEPDRSIAQTYPNQEELRKCAAAECADYELCPRADCRIRAFLIGNYRSTFPNYQQDKEHVEQSLASCCAKALEKGMQRFKFPYATLYGQIILCEITVIPVKYQDGHGFAFYIRDLREEKRREAAEEENRAKTRFLARMSHELRTPLSAVMGITELQMQNKEHSPETEEAFLRIHNSSSLLLTIINDILDLSKIEADKMELVPAEYELQGLIVDTVQLNMIRIGNKRIAFTLKIDERLPAYLIGDLQRIKQVLNNLLSNALKYTEEGSVCLSFGLEKAEADDALMLVVRVTDTGQGMTREQVDSLFEIEFTRFNMQSNHAIEGSGLGMMIAHHLVTIMRGKITVDSKPGKGSVFTVHIPQKQSRPDTLGKGAVERLQNLEVTQTSLKKISSPVFEPMPHGRVLAVDDIESNLYVVEAILSHYQINVETLTSGHDAVEKIKAGEVYDIIFMDYMMPGMDGIEATKIIRATGYGRPIVALTANAVKGAEDMFLENGFDEYMSKPIDIDIFNSCLTRHIRKP